MADTITREETAAPMTPTEEHDENIWSPLSKQERRVRLKALLDKLMADTSGYDQETWPELKAALDRDRLSDRKLFDE